ncbi:hypothetical protein C448_03246, partial [Halococcus morrhuae DSM 1307]
VIEGLSQGGAARIDGRIERVPPAWKVRDIDLGGGASTAVTIPWGDVSTAYYTTGIPNVETYATIPNYAASVMRKTGPLTPLLGTAPVQRALTAIVDATVSGPTADERAKSTTRIWGEVEGDGKRVAARLRTPDTYEFTARTATEIARRVCDNDVESGFQTPASAFGPEFVLEFDGVEREDVGRA